MCLKETQLFCLLFPCISYQEFERILFLSAFFLEQYQGFQQELVQVSISGAVELYLSYWGEVSCTLHTVSAAFRFGWWVCFCCCWVGGGFQLETFCFLLCQHHKAGLGFQCDLGDLVF